MASLVGKVNRKASSLKEILTLLPISLPSSNAKALDNASLTLLPNGKWNIAPFRPLLSIYPSTSKFLSDGMNPQSFLCSSKCEITVLAAPVSSL